MWIEHVLLENNASSQLKAARQAEQLGGWNNISRLLEAVPLLAAFWPWVPIVRISLMHITSSAQKEAYQILGATHALLARCTHRGGGISPAAAAQARRCLCSAHWLLRMWLCCCLRKQH